MFQILDELAPVKAFPRRKHNPSWVNSDIRDLMRERDAMAGQVRRTGLGLDELQVLKKRVRSKIREAAKAHRTRLLTDQDTSVAWKFIREVTFTTAKGAPIHVDANTLNETFASAVCSSDKSPLLDILGCDTESALQLNLFTSEKVLRMLLNLKVRTATGCDELS